MEDDESTTLGGEEVVNSTRILSPHEECMKERKWWCFLLSSVFTFMAGLFIILIWRAFAFLCCRNKEKSGAGAGAKVVKAADPKAAAGGAAVVAGGNEIGFMTEAKDWAGELISGQSTTGRILVSPSPPPPLLYPLYILSSPTPRTKLSHIKYHCVY